MKKQLKIKDLKITSFVTSMEESESATIKGGTDTAAENPTIKDCSLDCFTFGPCAGSTPVAAC
ncbi:MAG: hypothetical protein ACI81S_001685 [Sphingobacteriales bacterium]|jgi:hypothetical protein